MKIKLLKLYICWKINSIENDDNVPIKSFYYKKENQIVKKIVFSKISSFFYCKKPTHFIIARKPVPYPNTRLFHVPTPPNQTSSVNPHRDCTRGPGFRV